MKNLLYPLAILSCFSCALIGCAADTVADETDVTTYAPPPAQPGKVETRLEGLKRNAIDDTDIDLRVKRILKRVVDNMSAAAPNVPELRDPKITGTGCQFNYSFTRANGVRTEYRMNLNDFDHERGLNLMADDGVTRLLPGIGFSTRGSQPLIQVYENGVAMAPRKEWVVELDTRERVQEVAGSLIMAMRICQDPDFGKGEE